MAQLLDLKAWQMLLQVYAMEVGLDAAKALARDIVDADKPTTAVSSFSACTENAQKRQWADFSSESGADEEPGLPS